IGLCTGLCGLLLLEILKTEIKLILFNINVMAMKKLELKDVTFLINLKIDSIGRLENALVIIDFLMNNFDTEIKVMETSVHNSGILRKLLPKEVSYIYR